MIPRLGQPPVKGQRYKIRPGAYAVLAQGSAILLTYQHPEIQLPGGGIDPGEQHVPALHREIYEETGWTARIRCKLGAYRRFTYMPEYDMWAEKICHIYLARPALMQGPPVDLEHTPVWMPYDEAVEALSNDCDRSFLIDAKTFIR